MLDGGAYTSFGVITAYYAGFMIPTLYHIPNYRYCGRRMYTNKPPCGAMRGHGVPQPRFAFESLLDMLAEKIGMDPIDIRMANAMDPNTRTVNDLDVLSCEFKATLETVRERSGWDSKHGKLPFGRAWASAAAASFRARDTPSIAVHFLIRTRSSASSRMAREQP